MPDIVGRLHPPRLAAASSSPALGEQYYDTGTNALYWWNGAAWLSAGVVMPAWGVQQTLSDRSAERVSVMDNFSAAERADATGYTASIDTTAKVQAIVDYLTIRNGGTIEVGPGKYLWNNLILKTGVSLVAEAYRGEVSRPVSGTWPTQIVSTAVGWTIDTPSGASNNQVIAGFQFSGSGAGVSCGGVRLRNVNRGGVMGCFFTNYAEWAILQVLGLGGLFQHNTANNCLLDRTRSTDLTTLPHGVIELRGTDNWVFGGEYTASMGSRPSATFGAAIVTGTAQAGTSTTIQLAAGESAVTNAYAGWLVEITAGTGAGEIGLSTAYDGTTKTCTMAAGWLTTPDATSVYSLTPCRCLAGAFKGADDWLIGGIYETSEHGVYLSGGATAHRMVGCSIDQNSGHGLIIDGGAVISGSTSQRNSAAVDGGYDDCLITRPFGGSVSELWTGALSTDANQPRHGIHSANDRVGSDVGRHVITIGGRHANRRGKLVKVEGSNGAQSAPSITLPGGVIKITSGTTPSLDGWKRVNLGYGSATNITAFLDLIDGEDYTFTSGNSNVTFVQGTTIKNISAANVTLTATQAYKYTALNGVLYQC